MSDSVTLWTSLPDSSVHGILQARILEWVAMSSSRGSSQPRDGTRVSCPCSCALYHYRHLGSPYEVHPVTKAGNSHIPVVSLEDCCSVAKSCLTFYNLWTAAHQASLSFTISRSLPRLLFYESVMLSISSSIVSPLPSIFPSIRVL